jgi:hypothetical protein
MSRKIGGSVVGCGVHIARVLWFLGYDRHQNNTIPSNIRNHQLLDAQAANNTFLTDI